MSYPFYSPKLLLLLLLLLPSMSNGQILTLKDAVTIAAENYGTIRAKSAYVGASKAGIAESKREYLPNLGLSAQQDYGTANGQNGPLYGFGGLGVASSGPALSAQNWNAAFGGLYLANINWDFFSFGRATQKVKVAIAAYARDTSDLNQEIFEHKINVAAAYLNLLAAQQLTISQQKNLDRAIVSSKTATVRALNGLLAGVDSSLANAEVSNARIALTKALDVQQEQENRLAVLMGVPTKTFELDSAFIQKIPGAILEHEGQISEDHPLLHYYKSRISFSDQQTQYYKRFALPVFSLFGVFQTRGSGFDAAYAQDQTAYTQDYATGINPIRSNYLLGIGASWNLTSIVRVHKQVEQQQFISKGLTEEYNLTDQKIKAQLALAENKIKNALANYAEVPVQLKAAQDAYLQKNTLYKNGLTTLIDLTQTLYTLNRAETDRDIAYANVWQSLLLKAAATGDFNLFLNEF